MNRLYLLISIVLIGLVKSSCVFSQSITLDYQQTQQYSHVQWQRNNGSAIPIKLYPLAIQSLDRDRNIHNTNDLSEKNIEKRTASSPLNHMMYQLIQQSQQLDPDYPSPQYRLMIQLTEYQPLYGMKGDSWLSRFNEDMTAIFSFLVEDMLETRIGLNFHLFPTNSNQPIYQFEIKTKLDACYANGSTTLFFGNDFNATKMNALSQSAIGKTYVAAVNRGIEQVMRFISQRHIIGKIEQIDFNQVYLSLTNQEIASGQLVSIVDPFRANHLTVGERATIGTLRIAESHSSHSIGYPIDIKLGNIMVGDTVRFKSNRQSKPLLSKSLDSSCSTPDDQSSWLDMFGTDKEQQTVPKIEAKSNR